MVDFPTISCRDPRDDTDSRDDWRSGGYTRKGVDFRSPEHVIFLVHGYSNNANEAEQFFRSFTENAPDGHVEYIGFSWPTEDRVSRYVSDLGNSRRSVPALVKALQDIKLEFPEAKIHLIGHSMGARLIMKALSEKSMPAGVVESVCLMGGDASRWRFHRRRSYGRKVARKIARLLSLYSESDRILAVPARLIRPAIRIGAVPMHSKAPKNFSSLDAEMIAERAVRHVDYKVNSRLQSQAAHWCVNGVILGG